MSTSLTQLARRSGSSDTERAASRRLDLVRQLSEEFRERNDIFELISRTIYMQDAVRIPARWENFALEVKAPLALRAVNTITAALSVNAPVTHFEPVRMGSAGEANATLREHFFDAAWLRQEEEADRQLFRIWMHSLVTYGSAIFKTVECSKTAWNQYYKDSRQLAADLDEQGYSEADRRQKYDQGTEELKRKASYPIMTTVVPPSNFYYVQTERGFSVVAEVSDVPYYEALVATGASLSRGGRVVPEAEGLPREEWQNVMAGVRTLRKVEVWEWDRQYVYLSDPGGSMGTARLVKSVRHGYGNPLTHTLRGPYFAASGITTSSSDHKYAGLSVIFGFLYLYPLMNTLLTGMGEGALQWAYPFLGSDKPPVFPEVGQMGLSALVAPDGQPMRSTLQLQPGDILPDGIHFVDPPRLGMDMRAFMDQVKQLLELALPSVVQGLISGDTSGYALNQASFLAKMEWTPILENAQRCLSRRTGFESYLIERRISERVYAWGDLPQSGPFASSRAGYLSIAPEDLQGAHRYSVKLEAETPSNRVTDIRMHSELLAQRLETWEQAVEEMGNSPSEVEMGWLMTDLKNDERVKGKVIDRALALIAIREAQERAVAQTDLLDALGGGQPPGAGLGPTLGQVYQPGLNGVPLTPAPAGSAGGAPGPIGQGPATGIGPGATAGLPTTPQAHIPLPGQ